ncbi:M24 family metallopeptidase [Amycolatopsis sp. GM8]|uniref:M24 family metallopeptidase n=1 Tax=Amycolatopsis sp. GM8 TaxID=2896530 RepID=UPI001F38C01D|nr:M24 family metallopeptidase [Amycolatopsis sp. GM8]
MPVPTNPPYPAVALPPHAKPTTVPMQFMPTFSLAERDSRWDTLRKKMIVAKIDCLVFLGNDIYYDMGTANLRYVFHVGGKIAPYGAFFLDREPILWNSVPHMNRPYNFNLSIQDWVSDIRIFDGIPVIAGELHDQGYDRARIGLVGFSSTLAPLTLLQGEVNTLKAGLPMAEFVDASWILEDMRIIKSEEEISMLRKAGVIARKTIDALLEVAKPGVPEAEVFAEMIRTQVANGAEPNVFNLFNSGPVEHPETELWHLLHGVEQPQIPSMRPLAWGDIILTEYHTKYAGYSCHTEYTVHLGKPPQRLLDLYEVSLECLDISREVLREGVTLGEVLDAVRAPADRAKLDWVELGFHAMGLASPETPTVVYRDGYGSDALNGHNLRNFVLKDGMCFGNNIDLHDPSWKVDVGTMLSDFMVVRKDSAELLVETPRELGVVT